MKKRASPFLIGVFVVGAVLILSVALIAVAGGRLFSKKARAVMHFDNSVYGLQVGAPVVFRGVSVGTVTAISIEYDARSGRFSIPVVADLQRRSVRGINVELSDPEEAVAWLVSQGLTAQLSLQSLVTGQLYVDLDLRPGRVKPGELPQYTDAIEIPTAPTAIQNLKSQLDQIDFKKVGDDIASIAGSARELIAGDALKQAIADLRAIAANARSVTEKLDARIGPLGDDASKALASVGRAADQIGQVAKSVGGTADRLGGLVSADAPLVRDLQNAAAQLSQTAAALRRSTAEDGGLLTGAERALHDLQRAARQLRDLAETIENNPESLLRGRQGKDR